MTIEQLIEKTRKEAENAIAAEKQVQSVELEIEARDLALGWRLDMELATIRDERQAVAFNRRIRQKFVDVILTKPFSTGTTFLLTTGHDYSLFDPNGERDTARWEARITQSLWRDFFGRGTDLRHRSEEAELTNRKASAYFGLQNFLVDVENAYWDLLLAMKQEEILKRNNEYGKRLEKWTKERLGRSAAEKSDLLQAQALVSQNVIDTFEAQDLVKVSQRRFREFFPNINEEIVPNEQSLTHDRPLDALVVGGNAVAIPQRLDAITAAYLARQAEIESKRVQDSLKPRLDVYAAYGRNGISNTFGDAWDLNNRGEFDMTRVGVQISVDLNRGLVSDRVKAARLAAEARKLEAQTALRGSKVGWVDLMRQVNLLRERAKEAVKLADIQERKVTYERQRFRLGRSTVFQMVTYELDASNSQLEKFRALTDLRKAEAQARLFARFEQGEG